MIQYIHSLLKKERSMFVFFQKLIGQYIQQSIVVNILTYVICIALVILLCIIADKIAKKIIIKNIKRLVNKTKTTADEVFYEQKVFHILAHIAPTLVIYFFSGVFGGLSTLIQEVAMSFIVVLLCLASYRALDAIVIIFGRTEFGKNKPIKGFIQIVKIIVTIFVGLAIFTIFSKTGAATALIASLGGLSAVVLLVFRDSILGFVAGIQLSADHLLAIGDWLEMPKFGADGEVIDISLNKITVRNWDKTYTMVPAHKFLEESFTNWEGMTQAGGRRIKRAIHINVSSIGFLTVEQINDLSQINILKPYIEAKLQEIERYNKERGIKGGVLANGRHLTNVGTFRAYIDAYLRQNPSIQQDGFTLMVRQLPVGESGLPLEIYCFTNDTAWANYEKIQADIFDHILSVVSLFGLEVYQKPSGSDFKSYLS